MTKDIRLSIIIPCYKAAGTIVACLDSLAAQTVGDLEIIVVDDCSPDDSVSIVRDYARNHSTLRLRQAIHEVNGGVSKSRNDGVRKAAGDYVMFVDADDTLERDCCERLLAIAVEHSADCAACNGWLVAVDGSKSPMKRKGGFMVFSGSDYADRQCFASFFDTSCAKVYRRAFLLENHLAFDETLRYGEDTLFANCVALRASRLAVDSDYCGYDYIVGVTSVYQTLDVRSRLTALARLLEALSKASGGNQRVLLRKSLETLWTIRKHGGGERSELVRSLVGTSLWREVIYPSIQRHGRWKHRFLARLMNKGATCAIVLW